MKTLRSLLLLSSLALSAAPARAGTWQIGPSIGMEVIHTGGISTTVLAVPTGSELLLAGLRPGLRIGGWDRALRNEVFLDTSLQFISYENNTLSVTSNTLNFAHAFGPRSAPYVTFGAGFSRFSDGESSSTSTLFGGGLGLRERLRHGHGSIRTELRLDRAIPSERFADDVTIVGVHVGFDLDLD